MKLFKKGKSFALFGEIFGTLCLGAGALLVLLDAEKLAHLAGLLCGLGGTLLVAGAAYHLRLKRNPEKARQMEVEQNDERNRMIRGRAALVAFVSTTVLLAAMEMICFFIGEHKAAMLAIGVMYAHLACYWIAGLVLNKKL